MGLVSVLTQKHPQKPKKYGRFRIKIRQIPY